MQNFHVKEKVLPRKKAFLLDWKAETPGF